MILKAIVVRKRKLKHQFEKNEFGRNFLRLVLRFKSQSVADHLFR